MFRQIAFALGVTLAASAAFAQDAAETQEAPAAGATDPAVAYEAARNQLGILKFCEAQGFTGAEAVAAQEKMVGMLPEGDTEAGATAEQKGGEGMVAAGGAEISLEDAASQQDTTVEAQCQQIEAAVNQVAAQLPEG
ncbi:pore-forming ESAT-6 family protein [Paracoccus saliphilus]|uniref:Pore-forming ESAT-6 family protein n=1 Tax=Paracoccus saliphilus TaxID=405559 RepID=A0AA46A429_9RHOB|nr:pore-forming ESAT-6 family protein [Paracoccus saliphilus]WCR03485.1 pore-forming ESAT-6 family protein [Paracoccus saliphilus]SIS54530.1 hypothetical protein SAMN05421772_101378 [Paracoccus saliphilus]